MTSTIKITAEIFDANAKRISIDEFPECEFSIPTTAAEIGLSRKDQLSTIADIQQSVLNAQAAFLSGTLEGCPQCHSSVIKNGTKLSSFDHVYSSHKVKFQKWKCSSRSCDWQENSSFMQKFNMKLSPELAKIQSELGAQLSYRKASSAITVLTGKRKINNKSRIHRTTNTVGLNIEKQTTALCANDVGFASPIKELYVHVDGFLIHDDENRGHNFEAIVAKVYNPENMIHRGKKKRPEILKKHCAGSAKKDKQVTMKKKLIEACKLEGLTKDTTVTALSDGAKNCWNIIDALIPLCCTIIFILDWFHIGKYITNVKAVLPDEYSAELDSAKTELWYGRSVQALTILSDLKEKLHDEEHLSKIDNFCVYINDNIERIVNYNDRQEKGLIFTSSVAESTVNHFGSQRFKKLQQMQWKRENAHRVLQIRASIVGESWHNIWENNGNDMYSDCAA